MKRVLAILSILGNSVSPLGLAVLAVYTLALASIVALAFAGYPLEALIGSGGLAIFIGSTHSTLSDQTDSSTAIGAISVVGTVNGATLDMAGWEGVLITLNVGVITATGTLDAKAQTGALANASDMADLASSNITQLVAPGGAIVQISVYRPTNRYVRVVLTQATAAVLASATYTRFRRTGLNTGTAAGQPAQSPTQIVKVVSN